MDTSKHTVISTKDMPVATIPNAANITSALDFFSAVRDLGEPVVHTFNGAMETYVINDPEMIRQIFVTKQGHFIKGRGLQEIRPLVGNGVLTSEKTEHKTQRAMMQPHFNMAHIGTYTDKMVEMTLQTMAQWQEGEVRDTTDDMMEITMDIITHTMFGTSVKEFIDEIRESMHVALSKFSARVREPHKLTAADEASMGQAVITLNTVIAKIIEDRRQHPQEGSRDLLSILLRTGMSDEELRDQVMTIFLAGHETTANTLAWTWYLLSQHPEVEQKLWHELDTVLGGRPATYEDYNKLTYTHLIIQESMRLYPAAWVVGRTVDEDVQIGDYQFSKGQNVSMSQWAMHRNPAYYDRPDEFLPERFDGDLLKRIPSYAYFPFGGGPRVCIGNNFALLEAALVLATVGQRYKLVLEDADQLEPEPLITLRPKNLRMRVVKR